MPPKTEKTKIIQLPVGQVPDLPPPPADLPPPTFTLRADKRWHILALIGIGALMRGVGLPKSEQDELDRAIRLFEFYEESHR